MESLSKFIYTPSSSRPRVWTSSYFGATPPVREPGCATRRPLDSAQACSTAGTFLCRLYLNLALFHVLGTTVGSGTAASQIK